jgi:hypothetical protein
VLKISVSRIIRQNKSIGHIYPTEKNRGIQKRVGTREHYQNT